MGKRIGLFLLTNLAIVLTMSLLWSVISLFLGGRSLGGGTYGALFVFCLFWGMGGAFLSLQMSRWIAKRAMGVRLVDGQTGNQELDGLYETVRRLATGAGLPAMPEVGFYESDEVNAFATGPSKSKALVAVSSGLLRRMSRPEAEAVLAHEIAHVANGDMQTMTLIQGVVNAFVMFLPRVIQQVALTAMARDREGGGGAFLLSFVVRIVAEILFGIGGMMVVAWFSRQREFRADAGGAGLAGRQNMIAALRRLQQTHQLVDTAEPALATLKISGSPSRWMALFSTHPPLEVRIAALEGR